LGRASQIGDGCAWRSSGYTGVPNHFLDTLSTILPPSHFCVLLQLWRKTYGYADQRARGQGWIQISQTSLARDSNVSPRVVFDALKSLGKLGLIRAQANGFRRTSTIEVVFDFDLERASLAVNARLASNESRTRREPSLAPDGTRVSHQARTSTKERIKENQKESAGASRHAAPTHPFSEKGGPNIQTNQRTLELREKRDREERASLLKRYGLDEAGRPAKHRSSG